MMYKKIVRQCNIKECASKKISKKKSLDIIEPILADSHFQQWQDWSICSVSCDSGTRKRRRTCAAAANDGKPCPDIREKRELYREIRDCQIKSCPDPMWTAWTVSPCSVSCGFGTLTKKRKCEDFLTGEEMDPYMDCLATSKTDLFQVEKCEKPHCPSKYAAFWSKK